MSSLTAFLDAHGTAIRVIACAVVLFSFVFVAASIVVERRKRRSSGLFHAKFVKPGELRVERHSRRRSF